MDGPLQLAALPAAGGAYVLLIRLEQPLPIDIRAFAGAVLPAGLYAYCGSARGPGGLRARVARHLRSGKSQRWHVDCLTASGWIEGVAIRIGGRECDLVGELLATGCRIAVRRFGSTDCRRCPAHLLLVPGQAALSALAATILRCDSQRSAAPHPVS